MNLNELITRRQDIKDQLKALADAKTGLDTELAELDAELLNMLDDQGTTNAAIRADGFRISVSVSEAVVPAVTDWAAVYDYVKRTGRFELFERRMAAGAFREVLANEGGIDGVTPFTRRTINMQRRVAA